LTGDPSRAEDLVQETMLKAFRAWHRFRPGTNARCWLLTILRNSFINQYRKQNREPLAVDIDAVDPMAIYHRVGQTDPEGEFFGKLIDSRVLAAIDGLAIEFREVLVLSDIVDLSYAEISSMLEIPIGTVKSNNTAGAPTPMTRDQVAALDCDEALELLHEYLKRQLTPDLAQRVRAHIVKCRPCLSHSWFEANYLPPHAGRQTQDNRLPSR
jgi:RNA polymerase sigma-70 factor (ECF subfamily)